MSENGGLNTKHRYKVVAYTDTSLWRSSYVFAGLSELAHKRVIDLKLKTVISRFVHPVERDSVRLAVTDTEKKKTVKIAIDLFDKPMVFSENYLRTNDVYFKFNFFDEYLDKISPNLRAKVLPFGMCYAVRSPYDKSIWYRSVGGLSSLSLMMSDLSSTSSEKINKNSFKERLYRFYSGIYLEPKRLINARTIRDFEGDENRQLDPKMVFLTRVWTPINEDKRSVNEMRVNLIRTLRESFKEKFVGGLADNPLSRELYPDCIAHISTDPFTYTELVSNSLINIITYGAYKGPAWKLPETLAAGNCVVTETLRGKYPTPLCHGQEVMFFDTVDECVVLCERLLNDAELARHLRKNAKNYYQEEVTPSVRMLKTIQRAFEHLELIYS